MQIFNKIIEYKNWKFKSVLEYHFCLYLEQLQEYGFIDEFDYEAHKYRLSESVYLPYLLQQKTKIKSCAEFIMRENTYQPDFSIIWNNSSENLFFLTRYKPITCNIRDIPFRLSREIPKSDEGFCSEIEIKPVFEGKLKSSTEFNIIQKQLFKEQEILVDKIQPEKLFKQTFVPDKLIASNVYIKRNKYGTKGSSKYRFKIKTLQEYLKYRGYETL